MPTLSIRLFGRFCARHQGLTMSGLESRRVQELFCYLLLNRDRPHPREMLAGILWENTSTAQSKANLRKALWQLHAAIDMRHEASQTSTLMVDADWVQINPHADLRLDVAVFEHAFSVVKGAPGEQLNCQCAHTVKEAVGLYRGDLLEGWYQDWCLCERERLQNMYLALLDKLMGYCEVNQEYEHGFAYGARILRCDRAREQTHRRLMRLYYLAGDRTGALRQYERCVAALDEELGVRPTDLTAGLYEQIKADRLNDHPLQGENGGTEHDVTAPLFGMLDQLKQFQGALALIQRQVEQNIQAVEQALKARH